MTANRTRSSLLAVWTTLMVGGFLSAPVSAQTMREIALIEKLGAPANADIDQKITTENAEVRLTAYEAKFQKVAAKVAQTMAKRANGAEVQQLRQQAMAIIARENLTKEMVHDELDPIVKQLNGMVLPTREDVYAADANLATMRNRFGSDLGGKRLEASEQAAILYALCVSDAQRGVIVDNFRTRGELNAEEADGIDLTNRLRMVLGLNPLRTDVKLVETGRDHSTDMVKLGFFAHDSPVAGKKTPWDRAARFGTSASGENIAMGARSGPSSIWMWWYSPGHLKNMMNAGHNRIGLGQNGVHWTQLFGR